MGEPCTLCAKEKRFNYGEELEELINTAKNRALVADVYRLSEAKQSNEERSLAPRCSRD
jgi:phage baseplate assembly protein W